MVIASRLFTFDLALSKPAAQLQNVFRSAVSSTRNQCANAG